MIWSHISYGTRSERKGGRCTSSALLSRRTVRSEAEATMAGTVACLGILDMSRVSEYTMVLRLTRDACFDISTITPFVICELAFVPSAVDQTDLSEKQSCRQRRRWLAAHSAFLRVSTSSLKEEKYYKRYRPHWIYEQVIMSQGSRSQTMRQ